MERRNSMDSPVSIIESNIRMLQREPTKPLRQTASNSTIPKSENSSFGEDVVAVLTRKLLEEQRKSAVVEAENARLKSSATVSKGVTTLDRLNSINSTASAEINQVIDSIDRSLSKQEAFNAEAMSLYNPLRPLEEIVDQSTNQTLCRVRKRDLKHLIDEHKRLKEKETNSQVLIASLKEKEKKLETILDEERCRNQSPRKLSVAETNRLVQVERDLSREREEYTKLLQDHKHLEEDFMRLEEELQNDKQKQRRQVETHNYEMSEVKLLLEQERLQNESLKQQYKKLYEYIGRTKSAERKS